MRRRTWKAATLAKILRAPTILVPKVPYKPSPPGISLDEALVMARPVKSRHSPQKCSPHEAHFKPQDLHANVYCRLLASNPRQDFHTRTILPSTLMMKLGYTKGSDETKESNGKFGPISPREVRHPGPRAYLSPLSVHFVNAVHSFLTSRAPEYSSYKPVESPGHEQLLVLLNEVEARLAEYSPDGPQVAALDTSQGVESRSSLMHIDVSEIQKHLKTKLPPAVTAGLNSTGVRLAGALYLLQRHFSLMREMKESQNSERAKKGPKKSKMTTGKQEKV